MNALRSARLLRAAIGGTGPIDPTDLDWERWVELAIGERVIPLLYAVAVADSNDSERARCATEMQLDAMATAVRLEYDLLAAVSILARHDCAVAVIKGVATAHLDYASPEMRQFGDVDLLVEPRHFERAWRAFADAGWQEPYRLETRHRSTTHALTFLGPSATEVDLHQHGARRSLGLLMRTEDVYGELATLQIAGVELSAPSPRDRLVHAAIHMMRSRGTYRRLSSAADVLVMCERAEEPCAVLDRAERWRVRPLVEAAITDAYRLADLPIPARWSTAMARALRRRDRLVDRAYLGPRRRLLLEELAYLRLLPRTDLPAYLLGHVDALARRSTSLTTMPSRVRRRLTGSTTR